MHALCKISRFCAKINGESPFLSPFPFVTSLCTVDLLMPNRSAVLRTVSPLSTIYSPSRTARLSTVSFKIMPSILHFSIIAAFDVRTPHTDRSKAFPMIEYASYICRREKFIRLHPIAKRFPWNFSQQKKRAVPAARCSPIVAFQHVGCGTTARFILRNFL